MRIIINKFYFFSHLKKLMFVFTDVDECALGTDDCDVNTLCVDFPGSYRCGK